MGVEPLSEAEVAGRKGVLRKWVWIYVVSFAVIIAGLVGFVIVVLRDKPGGACEDVLGPLTRVEQRLGFGLVVDSPVGNGGDSDCELVLREAIPRLRQPMVRVVNRHANTLASTRHELESRGYLEPDHMVSGAFLYHATPGTGYHVVLYPHGETLSRIELHGIAWTIDEARAFVIDLTKRAP